MTTNNTPDSQQRRTVADSMPEDHLTTTSKVVVAIKEILSDSDRGQAAIAESLIEIESLLAFSLDSVQSLTEALISSGDPHCLANSQLNALIKIIDIPALEIKDFISTLNALKQENQTLEKVIKKMANGSALFSELANIANIQASSSDALYDNAKLSLPRIIASVNAFKQKSQSALMSNQDPQTKSNQSIDGQYTSLQEAVEITFNQVNSDVTRLLQFIDINNQLLKFMVKNSRYINAVSQEILPLMPAISHGPETGTQQQKMNKILENIVEYQLSNQNPIKLDNGDSADIELF